MSGVRLTELKQKFQQLDEAQKKRLLSQLKGGLIPAGEEHHQTHYMGVLSHAQNRLWVLEQLNHCSYLYHIPVVIELARSIEIETLTAAFRNLVADHPVLTSSLMFAGDDVKQTLNLSCEMDVQRIELFEELTGFIEISIGSPLAPFFLTQFNLEKAPLFRIGLLNTPTKSYLMMCFHHILVDGWSIELIINELCRYFQDSLNNHMDFSKPVIKKNYIDFIAWEQRIQKSGSDVQNNYWVSRLKDKRFNVDLMTDFPRKQMNSGQGKTLHFALSNELSEILGNQAKLHGLSINHIFLFGFQFLLSRYSGQDDIALGIPVAGRPQRDWYNTIGLFVNTCLHHMELDYQCTVSEQLERVKKQFIEDMAHANEPFDEVIKALYAREKLRPNQTFNILYNFIQSNSTVHSANFLSTKYCALPISKFDISLHVYACNSKIDVFFEYSTDLYKADTISQLLNYYLQILESISLNYNETLANWVWKLA